MFAALLSSISILNEDRQYLIDTKKTVSIFMETVSSDQVPNNPGPCSFQIRLPGSRGPAVDWRSAYHDA
jgi:hypothetical protein